MIPVTAGIGRTDVAARHRPAAAEDRHLPGDRVSPGCAASEDLFAQAVGAPGVLSEFAENVPGNPWRTAVRHSPTVGPRPTLGRVLTRLAWATATAVRGHDPDEPLALRALAARTVSVDVVDWDDPVADWSAYDRVVLRSTWDYPDRLGDFLAWLARVDAVTELCNPLPMVRWNLDKHYLAELHGAGVPTVATTFVEPGCPAVLPAGSFVVKPSIGAASRGVRIHHEDHADEARRHIEALHAQGSSALVQPLLHSIAADGEYPVVFLDGRFSHAVVRSVVHGPDGAGRHETSRAHRVDDEQLAVARSALEVVTERFGVPTYARIDLVRDDARRWCVLEVEVVEPSLFLPDADDGAADCLAVTLSTRP